MALDRSAFSSLDDMTPGEIAYQGLVDLATDGGATDIEAAIQVGLDEVPEDADLRDPEVRRTIRAAVRGAAGAQYWTAYNAM